jgi:hypothetical protein
MVLVIIAAFVCSMALTLCSYGERVKPSRSNWWIEIWAIWWSCPPESSRRTALPE